MFVDAVVFLSAIIGVLLAIVAFVLHLVTRKADNRSSLAVDQAANAALMEINRTSQLVLDELNTKHQELLFLYQLLDEKKKDIDAGNAQTIVAAPLAPVTLIAPAKITPAKKIVRKIHSRPAHPKYEKIKELQSSGLTVAEIAQQLEMGKGEVKLFINLAGR